MNVKKDQLERLCLGMYELEQTLVDYNLDIDRETIFKTKIE